MVKICTWEPMGSLVMSLSQKTNANKTQAMVKKLQLANSQNYKRTAMLIMQQDINGSIV